MLINYMKSVVVRIFAWLSGVVVVLYVVLGVFLYSSQDSLLFFPDKTDFSVCKELGQATVVTDKGFRAYYTKRSLDKVIVFYHGNAGRACDRSSLEQFFGERGYSTLLVEYPGYSENDAVITKDEILEDILRVDEFINHEKYASVVVVSESLGTGPAAYHVMTRSQARLPVAGVFITPYSSLSEVAKMHFPLYPMRLLVKNNFTPDEWLKKSVAPATFIIAEDDEVVGVEQGLNLYEVSTSQEKQKYVIKGAMHNTIYQYKEFTDILSRVLTGRIAGE